MKTDLRIFVPITKVDVAKRLVYGTLTEEVVDKSGEIFDYASGKESFKAWSDEFAKATDGASVGNLRSMHKGIAAGKFTDISFDDKSKRVEGCAKVVDDEEWNKVQEGVYTGFSIGGGYKKRWADPDNASVTRYTPTISEVSLVDNPCVPTAHFTLIKADGSVEERGFKTVEPEPAPAAPTPINPGSDVRQGWQAKDGSFHVTKAAAIAHNETKAAETVAADAAAPALNALKELDTLVTKGAPDPETKTDPAPVIAVEKTVDEKAADLKKGLWHIGRLCSLIEELNWFASDLVYEAFSEGDGSPLPAELKATVKSLGETLKRLVTEEVDELTAAAKDATVLAMGAGLVNVTALTKHLGAEHELTKLLEKGTTKHGKLGKKVLQKAHDCLGKLGTVCKAAAEAAEAAGGDKAEKAVHSRSDQEKLNKAHDLLMEVGAACKMAEPDPDDEDDEEEDGEGDDAAKAAKVAKAATASRDLNKVVAERDALAKQLAGIAPQIQQLVDRVKKLESEPLPGKGAKRIVAVNKSDEGAGNNGAPLSAEQLAGHINNLAPEERTRFLMKIALANPQRVG